MVKRFLSSVSILIACLFFLSTYSFTLNGSTHTSVLFAQEEEDTDEKDICCCETVSGWDRMAKDKCAKQEGACVEMSHCNIYNSD